MSALIHAWRVAAALALALLVAPLIWTWGSGDYYMVVTGESMSPTYAVGDVLAVQRPAGDELMRDRQIVVVSTTPGNKAEQYVHRVISHTDESATLQGDGNEIADPAPVTQDLVMGTPRFALQGVWADAFRFIESWGGRVVIAITMLPAFVVSLRRPARLQAFADTSTSRSEQATVGA
ncbi:S26 family signal peptidase [Leucobacter japonicus]|uniref:S26 family signal peptidase n=1 Tax=Leucobacter japonicus TaxID=1461259 RepID=UPI0006A7C45E|nr:S26 family signal peptidase [Leucobacter japonicus]